MAVVAAVACALLCVAAVATISSDNRSIALVDEVDGLELNAYLTPNDVEEFKKVSASTRSREFQYRTHGHSLHLEMVMGFQRFYSQCCPLWGVAWGALMGSA